MKKKKKILNYIVLRGLEPLSTHIAVLSSWEGVAVAPVVIYRGGRWEVGGSGGRGGHHGWWWWW